MLQIYNGIITQSNISYEYIKPLQTNNSLTLDENLDNTNQMTIAKRAPPEHIMDQKIYNYINRLDRTDLSNTASSKAQRYINCRTT